MSCACDALDCEGRYGLTAYMCRCDDCSRPGVRAARVCGFVPHMQTVAEKHQREHGGRSPIWGPQWKDEAQNEWDAALDAWQRRLTQLGDWAANETAKALYDGDVQAAEWYADLHARWRWQAGALYLCGTKTRRLKVVLAGGMMATLGAYAAVHIV